MNLKISKNNLLTFLFYELILVILILLTKECLDDKNYRLFLELSSFDRITYNPITIIYYIFSNIFPNSYIALTFLSISIGSLYNFSVFLFIKKFRTDFYKLSFLYLIPLFLCPVLIHFYSCTIKQGFATVLLSSSLLLYFSLDNKSKNKYKSYLIIIFMLLFSIITHWSTTLLLIFWGLSFLGLNFLIIFKNLLFKLDAFKTLIIQIKTRFRILDLFLILFVLIIPIVIYATFLDQQLEIQTKFLSYLIGEESINQNYGTRYPILSIPPSLFAFIKIRKYKNSILNTLSISSIFSGIIGFIFIKGPFVRIVIANSFFSFLALGIAMIKDKRKFKNDFMLFLTLNAPSIIYTFKNLNL